MILNREPVAIAAALRAVLLATMAFGLKVTAEQLAAVMVAVEAVLALATRQRVVPTDDGGGGGDGGQAGGALLWLVLGIVLGVLVCKAGIV